jgi:hypothetical protein
VTRGGASRAREIAGRLLAFLMREIPALGADEVFYGPRVGDGQWQQLYSADSAGISQALNDVGEARASRISASWALQKHDASIAFGGLDRYDDIWSWDITSGLRDDVGGFVDELGDLWEEALRVVAPDPSVLWGALYYDVIGIGTPYERYFGISRGVHRAEKHPRGYYGLNFLTAAHMAGLGGLERVVERCGELSLWCEVTERDGTDAGLLVGGQEAVSQVSDETLLAVRELLEPVLIREPYRWYGGPPLRVFKEPGTAYKPIPGDIIEPVFDDDPPIGPDSGTAPRLVPDP